LLCGGRPAASAVLIFAMGLMLLYNLYGKRIWFPLLSDAVQALAWVALALYGTLSVNSALEPSVGWLAAIIFVYVLMINGLHGGLRDLANDAHHGARTTALYLGARATTDGRLVMPAALVLYGLALQILLLFLGVLCVIGNWPEENRMPWQVMASAIAGAHVVLLWLARAALQATATRSEMIRAGVLHLFLSLGVVCLPFAFFTNTLATVVIIAAYALPLLILTLYLAWSSSNARSIVRGGHSIARLLRSRISALLCLLALISPSARSQPVADTGTPPVHVVSRQEIIRAMTVQQRKGYNLLATPNGARFNAGVILDLARSASQQDPLRTPIVVDHRDYFEAFLTVTGVSREKAPAFIQNANDHREDQYVDYRRENIVKAVIKGPHPEFAVNVVAGWTGLPPKYSYEDHDSEPPLRVTHDSITSYRLLDFGDMLLFDDIQGISGRALGGFLGLIFKLIGDARAVRAFIAIAPDGTQVTLSTGRKGPITVTPTATVDRMGRGMKGLPANRPDLVAIEERLKKPFEATYAPILRTEPFRWRRVDGVR
ncbi:MAG TPA: UbiA family prenyltransferase, partial [Thermoanaerobaculia bacterium]|nr:UbiA family prenyltransferase [Thermoanaerobaculia bacterium]